MDSFSVVRLLHSHGINVRYSGVVLNQLRIKSGIFFYFFFLLVFKFFSFIFFFQQILCQEWQEHYYFAKLLLERLKMKLILY